MDNEKNGLFNERAKEIYLLDDFTRFPTMEDHIIEYVSLVELRRDNNKKEFFIRNLRNRNGNINNVLVTLNGVVCTIDQIFNYDPLKIEKIEVYSSQFQLGKQEFTGAVNFLTYKDNLIPNGLFSNSAIIDHMPVENDNFVYEKAASDGKTPDMRVQLAWEPSLNIDQKGASLTYETSDVSGKYEIILSGITGDGYVYERQEIEVVSDQ